MIDSKITKGFTDTRQLLSWLEDWYAKNKYGSLIGAVVYFTFSLVALYFSIAVVGYFLTLISAQGSRVGDNGVGIIVGLSPTVVFVGAGTIFQVAIHNRGKIRLQFESTVLYYAGYRSIADQPSQLIESDVENSGWNSIVHFGRTTECKVATFPGWLFMKGYECLVHFKQGMAVNLPDASKVLAYMVRKDARCFPPELKDELPRVYVPAALAFLLQLNGVSAFDAYTPGIVIGNDRIEEWRPLID